MQRIGLFWHRSVNIAEFLGIVITLVLLPIDRLPYLHHTPFGLGFISLILLLLATADRLFRLVRTRNYAALKKYLLIGTLLALPVAAYAFSTSYAIDKTYALDATKLLLAVALRAFCFAVLIIEKPSLWATMKKTIYAVTVAVVAFGFFQFFFDVFGAPQSITDLRNCCTSNSTYVFPRVYSATLEPLYFDHFLMIPIWLLTLEFLKSKKSRQNKYLTTLFVATSSLFILTLARSAYIGILIASLVFYIGLRHVKRLGDFWKYIVIKWVLALIISVALVMMSGVVALFVPKTALHGSKSGVGSVGVFSSHSFDVNDGSAQTRYGLWPKSIDYFKERPLLGVGADNSRIRLNQAVYDKGVSPNKLQPFNNDSLGLAVDLGILGFLAFGPLLVMIVWIIIRLFKSRWAATTSAMALILIGMLIQGNFFHSLLLTRTWVVIGLLLASLYIPSSKNSVSKL